MDKKSLKNTIKNMPLSLPMGAAAIGTAASIWFANKRVHALCGMIWLGVSAVHTWQHYKKVRQDAAKVVNKMGLMDVLNLPKSKLDLFVRSVEVSSYIPGRVRLYSKALIGNKAKCQQVLEYLHGVGELDEVKVNEVTGSILILYTPQILRANKELIRVEEYIKTHVRR
ncbi:HMA2 domain-containing protein [Anaerovibrio lipolyticus]|uniref:HMA2 domain-containing protein n=1 Tax=Anaerovibrio lipolyticus TaxID=82374 RepID=UPI003211CD1B